MKSIKFFTSLVVMLLCLSSCQRPLVGVAPQQLLISLLNDGDKSTDLQDLHIYIKMRNSNVYYVAWPRVEYTNTSEERTFLIPNIPSLDPLGENTSKEPMTGWANSSFDAVLHFYSKQQKKDIAQALVVLKFEGHSTKHPLKKIKETSGLESLTIANQGGHNKPMVLKVHFDKKGMGNPIL